MKIKLLLFVGFLSFISCKQLKENVIPNGAFPITYNGHLYIKGDVNGVKGNYVFDTGASNLYFDSTYYANNGFHYENSITGILPGAGINPQVVVVITDSIEFKFVANTYKTSFVPILQLKPILGDFADGILGNEYFHNTILEINYEKEYMKIHSSLDSVNLQGFSKIELTKKENRFYLPLEVTINDTINISGEYILDFGSGGSVSLTSLVTEKYQLKENIENKVEYFTKYGGIGGESSSFDFFATQLKIGDFLFKNVQMDFSVDTDGALATERYLGILGNNIYERFDIFIDFINNDLYLKPNNNYNDLFESSKLGFSYIDRGQTLKSWIVTGLFSSSAAEKSGLMIDDKIISINGVKVEEIKYEEQGDFFKNINKVNLEIERNNQLFELSFELKPMLLPLDM